MGARVGPRLGDEIGGEGMELLVLSADPDPASVLPALGLLMHSVRYGPAAVSELSNRLHPDAILLDARAAPGPARMMCRLLGATTVGTPVLAVLRSTGWSEVSGQWEVADVLVSTTGPAEINARLQLAVGRRRDAADAATPGSGRWMLGGLEIDDQAYTARIHGHPMELTYREFMLLAHLAAHPGKVFTRDQLLTHVWGHDFYGGKTCTYDDYEPNSATATTPSSPPSATSATNSVPPTTTHHQGPPPQPRCRMTRLPSATT